MNLLTERAMMDPMNPEPSTAQDMTRAMAEWREGSDDHFYGAWRGGSRASGGGPIAPRAKDPGALVSQARDGGFTISAVGGKAPTDGFQVSPYGDRERKVSVSTLSDRDIERYVSDNADLLAKKNHYLGGWLDGDTVYLDVSVNARTIQHAEELGKPSNQIAAWDVKNGREVRFREAQMADKHPSKQRPPDVLLVNPNDKAAISAFVAALKAKAKAK